MYIESFVSKFSFSEFARNKVSNQSFRHPLAGGKASAMFLIKLKKDKFF